MKIRAVGEDVPPESRPWKEYLRRLEEQGQSAAVLLPAPVVAEFLSGIPEEKWPDALGFFRAHFQIAELNFQAAEAAAKIFSQQKRRGGVGGGQEKQCIRTDTFIVAIAIINNCERLFSLDERMGPLIEIAQSELGAKVSLLREPDIPQMPLF
ncbi:type II toxin-antitoxin system VapC family toxin [Meiothermus sp.]|uniref:type II toxin-antitoxin system VapC family toxin n=1 Tax=Meiothermus sp. TaxID=1955249 RepID=UPI0039A36CDD